MIAENTPEWFQARCGLATASLLNAVMSDDKSGKGPGKPFFTLVDEKVWEEIGGLIHSGGTGFAAQRGVELEPLALKIYAEIMGVSITKPGFVRHKSLAFGGSPDAVRSDGNLVEVKCPESPAKVVQMRCDQDVSEYRNQIQGQICVTGAEWCDLVIYDDRLPPDSALTVIRVPRDEAHIKRIEARVQMFNDAVKQRVAQYKKAET